MRFFHEWRILLDLLLISLLIYSIYRALWATGAWKIALGLTFAAGIALVARVLGLHGIEWIFSNFSQVALVALLIIFQPEIRRMLERFLSFYRSRRGGKDLMLPEIIDRALFDLAERRWGALVVFPGEVSIQQWVTGGTDLDALPGGSVLLSLFDPNSPGHDGAVVIEGNRIQRFGAHLPLSQTKRLSSEYGTRHHAAMGLSERTDALVFAVSEERGEVSAFRDGRLHKMKARGEAAELLLQFFEHREPLAAGRKTRKNLLYTSGEIVASLCLAALMWIAFIQPKTEIREMLFTVPIEYQGATKNMTLAGKQTEAKLRLEGPLSVLRGIDLSQLRVQVDLSSLSAGTHRIELADADIMFPNNLKLTEVQPEGFELEIRQVNLRSVPIQPQLIGSLPDGFILSSIEINPSSISIEDSGDTPFLTTTPIYLHGLRENVTVLCKIIVPEKLQPLERKWPDVTVQITISPGKKN